MDYYNLYKKYKYKYKISINKNNQNYYQYGGFNKSNHQDIFSNIYKKRIWAKDKKTPLSGAGSTKKYNKKYIEFLQKFIDNKNNDIKSILDLGCGDWTFTRDINFKDKKYLGIDCVASVIKNNKSKFSSSNIQFKHADFSDLNVLKTLLKFDLVIMKDVLQHWSDEDIIRILDYLTHNSRKPKYILIIHGKRQDKDKNKKRSVNNYYHYSNLNFKMFPLRKYNIKHLFDYQHKEVGLITN